jgi:hypothetical protein
MKVSELIERLQAAQAEHGDLPVATMCGEVLRFQEVVNVRPVDTTVPEDQSSVVWLKADESLGTKFIYIEDF